MAQARRFEIANPAIQPTATPPVQAIAVMNAEIPKDLRRTATRAHDRTQDHPTGSQKPWRSTKQKSANMPCDA